MIAKSMKFVFYTNSISPHQLPLARAIINRIGEATYRYIYTVPLTAERKKLGWNEDCGSFIIAEFENRIAVRETLLNADVVMSGLRDMELFEKRMREGRKTIYSSERWFKPVLGILRLLRPSYLKMALQFVKLLRKSDKVLYYPIGIHAARDMARLSGLFAGDLRCMFRAPAIDFEKKPGGKVWLRNRGDNKRYCLDKMRMWGYFVESSPSNEFTAQDVARTQCGIIKVLWVGRLLDWKRVDTIVRAVCAHANLKRVDNSLSKITLDIYGTGPEEERLKEMAHGYEDEVKFHPAVPIDRVRQLMREHDVYVLSSNAYEGWGAVVSEALEEGMKVIGTYEAGSSVTMLPESNLFHAGDWRALKRMLERDIVSVAIDCWSARNAAKCIWEQIKDE